MVQATPVNESRHFDYNYSKMRDLNVLTEPDAKTGKPTVTAVEVDGEPMRPTPRFWVSLFSKWGINKACFKFFDFPEVFSRISEREPNDRVRICVERSGGNTRPTLLAATNPDNPIVVYNELLEKLNAFDGQDIRYHEGIVESIHTPRVTDTFKVAGDAFQNRFCMSSPIDGYGSPNLYLMLLRMVCVNGMIAMSKAFKSSLSLGKGGDEVGHSIARALDSFNNEEGYSALRQRVEVATRSWASVYEAESLYSTLVKLHSNNQIKTDVDLAMGGSIRRVLGLNDDNRDEAGNEFKKTPYLAAYHRLTGDVQHIYGIANMDALSQKRQRVLPTKASAYDLINLATEVATHYTKPGADRVLNGWVGNFIGSGNEFDMEQTMDQYKDFSDFLVERRNTSAKELAAVSN